MNDELNEIPGATPDFRTELAEKLADLVPEAVADGKIDTKKLEELLDGDAADTRERFGLFWPGKKRALRAAQEPTTATLVPDKENSKDWDTTQNVFIEGDNLEVLKILQKHYHGKIKMIYIDPPYNTGKDFVYPDNYQEGLKSYLEFTKQVDEGGKKLSTNSDQAGRYHSNWLNMMYPRLKLARNLLTSDGVIFISIDDHEMENLKRVANEIFGEVNFVASLPRQTAVFGKNDEPLIASAHDYVLIYRRGALRRMARNSKAGEELYTLRDNIGLYRLGAVLDASSLPYAENLDFPIEIDGRVYEPSVFEGRRTCWRWGRDKVEFGIRNGLIVAKGGRLYTKTYKDFEIVRAGESYAIEPKEAGGPYRTNMLMDNEFGNRRATRAVADLGLKFDAPKPVSLVKKLMETVPSLGEGSIILDFFSGSGTTAHAVMELNAEDGGKRRHIQVQLPEPIASPHPGEFKTIADLARKRIHLAGQKIKTELESQHASRKTPIDVGYRTYRLLDTNFAKWRLSSDVGETELEQHLLSLRESADDQASQEALLTELLLKRGYSLTEQVDVFDVAGLEIHGVKDDEGDYGLLAYLNEHQKPSLEQLRALVNAAEAQVVILEDAFQGDDQLKTNLSQLCKSKGIELWTA